MNSKNNNPMVLVGVAGLVLVLGAGAWFFMSAETDHGSSAPITSRRDAEVPKSDTPTEIPKSDPLPERIKTESYSARHDPMAASASASAEPTGLRASGIVLNPDGRPLESAEVTLIRDMSAIRARSQDGETLAKVTTGGSGEFAFDNLESSSYYIVQASHRDFTTERRSPVDTTVPASLRMEIRLAAGLTISGLVTDLQGSPIPGAEVLSYDMNVQTLDPVQEPERSVKAGGDGRYSIEHLCPGLKKVLARKDGFSSDGRNALDVREGQPLDNINFSLSQGFAISGIVTDQKLGRPIKGAQITARPINYLARANNAQAASEPDHQNPNFDGAVRAAKEDRGDEGDLEAKRVRFLQQQEALRQGNIAQKSFLLEMATTDEEGRFKLIGLMEARYMLQIRAPGYQPNNNYPADAGSEGHMVALPPSARIGGRVIDDESGQPIANFRVAVLPNRDAPYVPTQLWQRFKSPDGNFDYLDVRPGTQFVHVEADGFAGGKSDQLQIGADEQLTGIIVRVVKGARLFGFVKSSDGKPVSGVRVDLVPGSGAGALGGMPDNPFAKILEQQMRANTRKRGITDGDGRWMIDAVVGGTYRIKTDHSDYSEGESPEFTCESRGELKVADVPIRMGGVIRGLVKKTDGAPDGRATVMIANADQSTFFSRSVATGADGRFEIRGLKTGSYSVTVTQRDGVFDLVSILQRSKQPGTIVSLNDGDVKDVQL